MRALGDLAERDPCIVCKVYLSNFHDITDGLLYADSPIFSVINVRWGGHMDVSVTKTVPNQSESGP